VTPLKLLSRSEKSSLTVKFAFYRLIIKNANRRSIHKFIVYIKGNIAVSVITAIFHFDMESAEDRVISNGCDKRGCYVNHVHNLIIGLKCGRMKKQVSNEYENISI
jgi:hypothetical protein